MGGVKANGENEQKKAVISHIVANKEMRFCLMISNPDSFSLAASPVLTYIGIYTYSMVHWVRGISKLTANYMSICILN